MTDGGSCGGDGCCQGTRTPRPVGSLPYEFARRLGRDRTPAPFALIDAECGYTECGIDIDAPDRAVI